MDELNENTLDSGHTNKPNGIHLKISSKDDDDDLNMNMPLMHSEKAELDEKENGTLISNSFPDIRLEVPEDPFISTSHDIQKTKSIDKLHFETGL